MLHENIKVTIYLIYLQYTLYEVRNEIQTMQQRSEYHMKINSDS